MNKRVYLGICRECKTITIFRFVKGKVKDPSACHSLNHRTKLCRMGKSDNFGFKPKCRHCDFKFVCASTRVFERTVIVDVVNGEADAIYSAYPDDFGFDSGVL